MSPSTSRVDNDSLIKYINDNLNMRVIIDKNDELFMYCGISGYPTKFIINPNGKFLVYSSGVLNGEGFVNFVDYAKSLDAE